MSADATTRALLILILACLLILVVQGFASCGQGRYQVTTLGSEAPGLIRVDTKTGALWKLEPRNDGNRWVPIVAPEEAGAATRAAPQQSAAPAGAAGDPGNASRAATDPPATPAVSATPRGPGTPPTEAEIQLFVDALAGEDLPPDVRVWTARQLGQLEGTQATEALLAALGDPSAEVVAAAAEALARRRDPRIGPALDELRSHPDPAVQRAARAPRTQAFD